MREVTVLKLKTGETVLASVRIADNNTIWLDDPIQVVSVPVQLNGATGETFTLKPWIGISDDRSFLISSNDIVTTGSLRDSLAEQYNSYVGNEPDRDNREDELDMLQSRILRSRGLLN